MARSPEDERLAVGVVVKLKGLVGGAKHNGKHGELVNFDEEKGRWAVSPPFSTFLVCTRRREIYGSDRLTSNVLGQVKLQSDLSILGVKPVFPIQPTTPPALKVSRHGVLVARPRSDTG